ncbi:FkbM family methyltransferase [Phenylobacterium sp.]|uniref:FkbM family methyltransferase n=1 Tax=Phenylobacterium sp. TaxID=1871053 RepID=UPI00271BF113|nr:FkbM family methyltransferase [Phenylobacterium sp.]MDO8379702.1 FkbM family methyltransferase [Phenylobacterium sp.]
MILKRRVDFLAHLLKASLRQHHRELIPVFQPLIPADGVIVDVGAHAGQFSKLFAKMAPRGRVYAFEPSAYARSILTRALAFNRLSHVKVIPMGLSDAPADLILRTPIKSRGGLGFGIAHFGEDGQDARDTMDQVVPLTTLDAFAQAEGLTRLDFLKADVEGWEVNVLKGGLKTLAKHRPALFLEISDASLARAGARPTDIWDLLRPLGYHALKAPDFVAVDGYAGVEDYLFVAD